MIIKICGIQNQDTLICCENNSINFFGMIFYLKVQEIYQLKMQINSTKNFRKIKY